jgi:hypothetical protein
MFVIVELLYGAQGGGKGKGMTESQQHQNT